MKFRIIEYEGQLYVAIGITNLRDKLLAVKESYECFEAIPLNCVQTLYEAVLCGSETAAYIKIEDAKEITERHRLEMILILYG
jgi:hypothetical protein